jgi:hypothetical protein
MPHLKELKDATRRWVKQIALTRLCPPHEVKSMDHLHALVQSLRGRGWDGPPLVGYYGSLLTGSHRFEAANELGLNEVPVLDLAVRGAADELFGRGTSRELVGCYPWGRTYLGPDPFIDLWSWEVAERMMDTLHYRRPALARWLGLQC